MNFYHFFGHIQSLWKIYDKMKKYFRAPKSCHYAIYD